MDDTIKRPVQPDPAAAVLKPVVARITRPRRAPIAIPPAAAPDTPRRRPTPRVHATRESPDIKRRRTRRVRLRQAVPVVTPDRRDITKIPRENTIRVKDIQPKLPLVVDPAHLLRQRQEHNRTHPDRRRRRGDPDRVGDARAVAPVLRAHPVAVAVDAADAAVSAARGGAPAGGRDGLAHAVDEFVAAPGDVGVVVEGAGAAVEVAVLGRAACVLCVCVSSWLLHSA